MTINTHKTLHGAPRLWAHLCVWIGKNPKTPNLSPMADDAITRGNIGLGSPAYIYGLNAVIPALTSSSVFLIS